MDLMVELDEAVEHPARLSAWLSVKVMRATQGRKVDVILAAPNLEELPIHRIAREQGVILGLRHFTWIWPDRAGGPLGCQSGRSWR
ncbi:MAG: hypothetical protein ACQEXC_14865 [Pseudomonadota bacterium]